MVAVRYYRAGILADEESGDARDAHRAAVYRLAMSAGISATQFTTRRSSADLRVVVYWL